METCLGKIFQVLGPALPYGTHKACRNKAQRLDRVYVGERGRCHRKKSLKRVAECISGSRAHILVGEGFERIRVGQADIGSYTTTHNGDFAASFGIVDDGELGYIGTGAARGRTEDKGREWPKDLVRPFEILDPAAIGNENGDTFGGVHGTSAAKSYNDVRACRIYSRAPASTSTSFGLGVMLS